MFCSIITSSNSISCIKLRSSKIKKKTFSDLLSCIYSDTNNIASNVRIQQRNPDSCRTKKKIQGSETKTMGEMGSRDKRPIQSCQSLVRHIRHSRSRCPSLRRSCPPIQRQQGQTQLPRKCHTPAAIRQFSDDPVGHFGFSKYPFGHPDIHCSDRSLSGTSPFAWRSGLFKQLL